MPRAEDGLVYPMHDTGLSSHLEYGFDFTAVRGTGHGDQGIAAAHARSLRVPSWTNWSSRGKILQQLS